MFNSRPFHVISGLLKDSFFSSTFLVIFITLFQKLMCSIGTLHRLNPFPFRPYAFTFPAGFLAGLAVMLEKKHRRGELALYVLPKAVEVMCKLAMEIGRFDPIPQIERIMLSIVLATIMTLHSNEKQALSPTLCQMISYLDGSK
jgi:hypothetical protein